jgi:hypothetical protein
MFCRNSTEFFSVAQLDEVSPFLGTLRSQETAVPDNANRNTPDVGKTGYQCFPVVGFKFLKPASVNDPCDYRFHINRFFQIERKQPV